MSKLYTKFHEIKLGGFRGVTIIVFVYWGQNTKLKGVNSFMIFYCVVSDELR